MNYSSLDNATFKNGFSDDSLVNKDLTEWLTSKLPEIETLEHVELFCAIVHRQLSISWHPDDGFLSIVNRKTGELIHKATRKLLEEMLDKIFTVVNSDELYAIIWAVEDHRKMHKYWNYADDAKFVECESCGDRGRWLRHRLPTDMIGGDSNHWDMMFVDACEECAYEGHKKCEMKNRWDNIRTSFAKNK
tara:strand:- start:384 stop:953 length:570 start_codon:yes stop_codon:yes gene_type:complete